ncbi:unnamed protein product [Vitrella brassicaformis CCMP3155]|uniref:Uncharacterized protein n=2 Tax=Vitrella brassicaformis TaxID=1169539 RepID=A0A0G4EN05_VITBC|nr:unnamed protein product [Vitrella brassicaformis CCMP3155]|mmetsp:Transcript_43570/g.123465  ORF Transcript_43570/g.123465 Transcript_43570/m.123465 type:complete len:545 (+) Transcript_43570:110-1744(+)|eukprot:CEL98370.1 unnamed protein product [Vitrella brassicaformis CCMP3155]
MSTSTRGRRLEEVLAQRRQIVDTLSAHYESQPKERVADYSYEPEEPDDDDIDDIRVRPHVEGYESLVLRNRADSPGSSKSKRTDDCRDRSASEFTPRAKLKAASEYAANDSPVHDDLAVGREGPGALCINFSQPTSLLGAHLAATRHLLLPRRSLDDMSNHPSPPTASIRRRSVSADALVYHAKIVAHLGGNPRRTHPDDIEIHDENQLAALAQQLFLDECTRAQRDPDLQADLRKAQTRASLYWDTRSKTFLLHWERLPAVPSGAARASEYPQRGTELFSPSEYSRRGLQRALASIKGAWGNLPFTLQDAATSQPHSQQDQQQQQGGGESESASASAADRGGAAAGGTSVGVGVGMGMGRLLEGSVFPAAAAGGGAGGAVDDPSPVGVSDPERGPPALSRVLARMEADLDARGSLVLNSIDMLEHKKGWIASHPSGADGIDLSGLLPSARRGTIVSGDSPRGGARVRSTPAGQQTARPPPKQKRRRRDPGCFDFCTWGLLDCCGCGISSVCGLDDAIDEYIASDETDEGASDDVLTVPTDPVC